MLLRRVKTVVFAIDASNRIVRVYDGVFNRPGYVHQHFGALKEQRSARGWYAVKLTFPDAVMTLGSRQHGKDKREFGDGTFSHIDADIPTPSEYWDGSASKRELHSGRLTRCVAGGPPWVR
ncbi:MAG: hypothetical protein JNL18_02650 [Planctomycetaceae bacterium]|nr:hypothetical protein [Planctomycetaceae bacterium]